MTRARVRMRVACSCLVVVSVGILVFGGGHGAAAGRRQQPVGLGERTGVDRGRTVRRADRVGPLPPRRGEAWAWWALWFYPIFWTAHLVGGLPPGKDHIHQIAFIVLSLVGLLLTLRDVVGANRRPGPSATS